MINLSVVWKRIWYNRIWFSPYEHGKIAGDKFGVSKIYRHKKSGQIRLYSNYDKDGVKLSVNGESAVTMKKRGRFGKLYLGFKEN